jgi:hypothetical protein
MIQWIIVILIGVIILARIVLKIYKSFKNKNNTCGGCAHSDSCALKKMKSEK